LIGMVLAAGAGRRLRPDTDALPKALLPVDGEVTILDIALRNLAAVGLRDIVIVVGYAADVVRDRLFEPFVSHGKENGTGMGLTVVQKILQDHGGEVAVEQTSPSGTTFRVNIPLNPSVENAVTVRHAT